MKEAIIRVCNVEDDVEIAIVEDLEPVFKKITVKEFLKLMNMSFASHTVSSKKIKLLNDEIIGLDKNYVLIKQEERKRIVTLNLHGFIRTYKISYPNSIYVMEHNVGKVINIECYSYREYKGKDTELFVYPMPNELYSNKLCIGNADRSIKEDDYVRTLERIIFGTPFSHAKFSGINGFSDTINYFEYLEKNEFPYKLLKPLNKKLEDILEG